MPNQPLARVGSAQAAITLVVKIAFLKFEAVLFDCDGVLVDSEPLTNGVLRDMLEEAGWKLSSAECMRLFIGKAVKDGAALIEEKTGRLRTDEWLHEFRGRRT